MNLSMRNKIIAAVVAVLVIGGGVFALLGGTSSTSGGGGGTGSSTVPAQVAAACTSSHVVVSLTSSHSVVGGVTYQGVSFSNLQSTPCELAKTAYARAYDTTTGQQVGRYALLSAPGKSVVLPGKGEAVATFGVKPVAKYGKTCQPTSVKAVDFSVDGVSWSALPVPATVCRNIVNLSITPYKVIG